MEGMTTGSDTLDQVQDASTAFSRETQTIDDRLALVMVRMVIVSLMFLGACFVFGQIFLQIVNSNNMWKPASLHQPALWVGITETVLVVGGWICLFSGQLAGVYNRNWSRLTVGAGLAVLLALVSFGFHIYELHSPGFHLQSAYAGIFIVTEAIYTCLLAAAIIVLIGITNRARLKLFTTSGVAVEATSEFFGFVAAVGVFNFLMLYIQPFFHSA